MINELTYNVGVFAAFKGHSQGKELAKLLRDENGNLRPFKEFKEAAEDIMPLYNKTWLKTEYDQAVTAARMAKKWQDAQKTKNTYPNLQYIAVMDDRTRELHRGWHGITLPVDHKFWNTHYPPNDWGCRCTIRRTDKPVDDKGLNVDDMPDLPKQFNINVGKDGKIFSNDHPYLKTREYRKVGLDARSALINFTQKELLSFAREKLTKAYRLPGIPETVEYSPLGIRKHIDRNKKAPDWYQTVALLYDVLNLVKGVEWSFDPAGDAQKDGVLGRYLGYKIIGDNTYEICFRKTRAKTTFYYIRRIK